MEISSSRATESGSTRDAQKLQELEQEHRRPRGGAPRPLEADAAVISNRGQLLQHLAEAVRQAPDVRDDRVDALREAVEQGRYRISEREIAEAILASRKEWE